MLGEAPFDSEELLQKLLADYPIWRRMQRYR